MSPIEDPHGLFRPELRKAQRWRTIEQLLRVPAQQVTFDSEAAEVSLAAGAAMQALGSFSVTVVVPAGGAPVELHIDFETSRDTGTGTTTSQFFRDGVAHSPSTIVSPSMVAATWTGVWNSGWFFETSGAHTYEVRHQGVGGTVSRWRNRKMLASVHV